MTQVQTIDGALAAPAGMTRGTLLRDSLDPGGALFSEELNRQLEEPRVERDDARSEVRDDSRDEVRSEARDETRDRDDARDEARREDHDSNGASQREAAGRVADRRDHDADRANPDLIGPDILVSQADRAPHSHDAAIPRGEVIATESLRQGPVEVTDRAVTNDPVVRAEREAKGDDAAVRTNSEATRPTMRPQNPVAAQEADRNAEPTTTDPVRQLRQGATETVPTAAKTDSFDATIRAETERPIHAKSEPLRVRQETEENARTAAAREETQRTEPSARSQTAALREQQQGNDRADRSTRRAFIDATVQPSDAKTDARPESKPAPTVDPDRAARVAEPSTPGTRTSPTTGATPGVAVAAAGEAAPTPAGATFEPPSGVLGVSSTGGAKGSAAAQATTPAFRSTHTVPVDRILQQVRHAIRGGVQELKLRLDPPELGRLNLRLQMDGESLTVTVRVTSAEVAAALRAELSNFHDTLKDAGIDLTSLDIDVEGDDNAAERGDAKRYRDGAESTPRTRGQHANETTESGTSTGARRSPLSGRLDVTA